MLDDRSETPRKLEILLSQSEASSRREESKFRLSAMQLVVQIVQVLTIGAAGFFLSLRFGQEELKAQRLELISSIIREVVQKPESDPFALLPLVSSFRETAVPHLVGLLEAEGHRLSRLLPEVGFTGQQLGESLRWPLPDEILADGCKDPRFAENLSFKYSMRLANSSDDVLAAKAASLAQTWSVWKAASSSLRSLADEAIDYLSEEIDRERGTARTEVLLRILNELAVHAEPKRRLMKILRDRLLDDRMTGQARGITVNILAKLEPGTHIQVPKTGALDLACLDLRHIVLEGSSVPSAASGPLDLTNATLSDVKIIGLHHSDTHFRQTSFDRVTFRATDLRIHSHGTVDSSLPSAFFLRTKFEDAVFRGELIRPQFDSATVKATRFEDVYLSQPIFTGGELEEVDFSDAVLDAPIIKEVVLRDVRLNSGELRGGEIELNAFTAGSQASDQSLINGAFAIEGTRFVGSRETVPQWVQSICNAGTATCIWK